MMRVGGLGLARGGTGAKSRVRAPMAGPSSPSAELQRLAGPSAAVKLSCAESVLLWAVMEMRGGAWLPGGMGGGAFLKLKATGSEGREAAYEDSSLKAPFRHTHHLAHPPDTVATCTRLAAMRAKDHPIIWPRKESDMNKVT